MRLRLLLFAILSLSYFHALGQDNGIIIDPSESYIRESSAVLQVGPRQSSIATDFGGFLVPRMTLSERGNIGSPATGLMIYQTDNNPGHYYYDGSSWRQLFAGNFPAGSADKQSITMEPTGPQVVT